MSKFLRTTQVFRGAPYLLREKCVIAARYGSTCDIKKNFSTSLARQKRGRTLAKLLGAADPALGYRSLNADEQSWLRDRGYEADQIARWIAITQANVAKDALRDVSEDIPNFLVLSILRLPPESPEVFYKMIQLFKLHSKKLDNSSCLYAVEALIRHALTLDPDLLSLLDDIWMELPESLGPYVFNRLLAKICADRSSHLQIAKTQKTLVGVMRQRDHLLDRTGYQALLSSSLPDPVRYTEIQNLMTSAGYTIEDSPWRKRKQDTRDILKIFAAIKTAKTRDDYLNLFDTQLAEMINSRFWVSLFALQDNNQHVLKFCITILEAQRINISSLLASLMLKRCRFRADMHIVDAIVKEVASSGISLGTSGWAEYLKRLIFAGKPQEALDILVNDPGGNDIIDMPSISRIETVLWYSTVKAFNTQRRFGTSGRRHAKYLGHVVVAMRKFKIPMSPNLLGVILEAAVLSGPRVWGHKHSCDTAVGLFNEHVDLGKEPWKIRADVELWTRYLLILVANEEVSLLGEAMNHLLNSKAAIDQAQLNLFSIGVWESGSFEAVQQWQEYFDQSGLPVTWPDAAETWAFKEALESRELQYFRA